MRLLRPSPAILKTDLLVESLKGLVRNAGVVRERSRAEQWTDQWERVAEGHPVVVEFLDVLTAVTVEREEVLTTTTHTFRGVQPNHPLERWTIFQKIASREGEGDPEFSSRLLKAPPGLVIRESPTRVVETLDRAVRFDFSPAWRPGQSIDLQTKVSRRAMLHRSVGNGSAAVTLKQMARKVRFHLAFGETYPREWAEPVARVLNTGESVDITSVCALPRFMPGGYRQAMLILHRPLAGYAYDIRWTAPAAT